MIREDGDGGREDGTKEVNHVRFTAVAEGWPAESAVAGCGTIARDALRGLAAFPVTCGDLSCGACHIYLPATLAEGDIGREENDLLDLADAPRRRGSRLACQVRIRDQWQGAVVEIATPARPRA
jgi:ferredoxin